MKKNTKVTITNMIAYRLNGPTQEVHASAGKTKEVYWCDSCSITRLGSSTAQVVCPVCKKHMESIGGIEIADKTYHQEHI